MVKKILALAALVASPLMGASGQTFDLFPTDGGSNWQVSCTVLGADSPPTGPCNGVYSNATRVTATPGGWASTPVAGPAGNAYYISTDPSASIWGNSPNENPHYEYTFKTKFNVSAFDPGTASLNLNVFRLDNYFVGWSLNSGLFSSLGISPGPLPPNGSNWTTPFQLNISNAGFNVGENTLELRIQGNGRTDAILAQGTYSYTTTVPEPSTLVLLVAGLGALGFARRRRVA